MILRKGFDDRKSSPSFVTPAEAGLRDALIELDSGFRRNDGKVYFLTFYEFIISDYGKEDLCPAKEAH